jgi:hypothetical protein
MNCERLIARRIWTRESSHLTEGVGRGREWGSGEAYRRIDICPGYCRAHGVWFGGEKVFQGRYYLRLGGNDRIGVFRRHLVAKWRMCIAVVGSVNDVFSHYIHLNKPIIPLTTTWLSKKLCYLSNTCCLCTFPLHPGSVWLLSLTTFPIHRSSQALRTWFLVFVRFTSQCHSSLQK